MRKERTERKEETRIRRKRMKEIEKEGDSVISYVYRVKKNPPPPPN